MLRTLVRCGLALALLALLAPPGNADARAAANGVADAGSAIVFPGSSPAAARSLAQSDMPGHAGDANMARFAIGDLVVENPWARESVTPTGAAYLTVRNDSDRDDRLVGVSSEVAEKAELHTTMMQDGVMRMRPLDAVDVPAHGEAVLAPGGIHVMLVGLKEPLRQGQSFALTLNFEHAGEVVVTTTVEDIAYGGAGHAHGQHE